MFISRSFSPLITIAHAQLQRVYKEKPAPNSNQSEFVLQSVKIEVKKMALSHFFDDFTRPTQLLDQHFGLGLHPEEIFSPMAIQPRHHHHVRPYYRPWRVPTNDNGSVVTCEKDKFLVSQIKFLFSLFRI